MNAAFKTFAAALLGAAFVTGCSISNKPDNVAQVTPIDVPQSFGVSAYSRVAELLKLGTRDAMTDGAAKTAEWIATELKELGLSPKINTFDDPSYDGTPRIFRNVTASLPGQTPKHILLLSHYDTKSGISTNFVGANDGGSSTGLLLELANWYKRHPRKASITFAFLDGEECAEFYNACDGLHGSRRLSAYMKHSGTSIDAVILLDMIGDRDLNLTIPKNVSPSLKTTLATACKMQKFDDFAFMDYDMLDDHQPFIYHKYPAVDIIDFEYGSMPLKNDYWHTPEDTLDKLSPDSLQTVGAIVIQMIELL